MRSGTAAGNLRVQPLLPAFAATFPSTLGTSNIATSIKPVESRCAWAKRECAQYARDKADCEEGFAAELAGPPVTPEQSYERLAPEAR